jgi:hypothetical protein
MTVRKITDFTVGDRIVAATYEISYLKEDGIKEAISDLFDDIYLSTNGGHRPVRFRFEEVDSNEVTLVDVHDRPDTDDFYTIELAGHHHLQFTSPLPKAIEESDHEAFRSESSSQKHASCRGSRH